MSSENRKWPETRGPDLSSEVRLVPATPALWEAAAEIRAALNLRTQHALHAATSIQERCILIRHHRQCVPACHRSAQWLYWTNSTGDTFQCLRHYAPESAYSGAAVPTTVQMLWVVMAVSRGTKDQGRWATKSRPPYFRTGYWLEVPKSQ